MLGLYDLDGLDDLKYPMGYGLVFLVLTRHFCVAAEIYLDFNHGFPL